MLQGAHILADDEYSPLAAKKKHHAEKTILWHNLKSWCECHQIILRSLSEKKKQYLRRKKKGEVLSHSELQYNIGVPDWSGGLRCYVRSRLT